jgi:hypothetical protein
MNSINLKDEVRRAIDASWPQFQADHPHLAAAIDQDILVMEATRAISEDPEFNAAMQSAAAAGIIATGLGDMITRLTRRWLWSLL